MLCGVGSKLNFFLHDNLFFGFSSGVQHGSFKAFSNEGELVSKGIEFKTTWFVRFAMIQINRTAILLLFGNKNKMTNSPTLNTHK